MKYISLSIIVFLSLILTMCDQKPENQKSQNISEAPTWAKDAIWYQIFVERFSNGDKNNDPKPDNIYAASN